MSKISPCCAIFTPKDDNIWPIRATSTSEGTLRMRHSSGHSKDPAIIASAEFFAPLIFTWPCIGFPPQICKTEGSASGDAWASIKPREVVIGLSSKIND